VINRTESRLIALEQRNQVRRSRQRQRGQEPTATPPAPTATRKTG
jgi:hypothetical protein